jgi:hypothetical protein
MSREKYFTPLNVNEPKKRIIKFIDKDQKMSNEQNDIKTRLAQILDKQRSATQSQRRIKTKIVSWVGSELHPAFNTLRKLLEDERGVVKISIAYVTFYGETLEFEVRDVFHPACIRYAVKQIDSEQEVMGDIELTVNGNEIYKPEPKNILHWHQDDIINDFLMAFEKWNG